MPKKDFKNNPALSFISQETIDKVDQTPEEATSLQAKKSTPVPKGYKLNPQYIETKSKRVQALIQPSVYKEAKKVSKKLGISMNDFINRAMKEASYNESVQDLIKQDIKGDK